MSESANGILILNKSAGMTSQSAVSRVRRLFDGVKAGHTGTLDPMATGVLPILLGRAVKASEYMLESGKHYRATLRLGVTTDTEDTTGHILSTSDAIPDEATVLAALDAFRGEILQTPPMYSALKVGGRKLVDLARAGEVIERTPRSITVYALSGERVSDTDYTLDVHCSKGTYIRTLCADIGRALGCGGTMASLLRTEAAGFPLSAAHTLEELEALDPAARAALLYPTEHIFRDLQPITLPAFFAHLAKNGVEIYLHKLGLMLPLGTRVRLCDGAGFFALGEVRAFDGGNAIKPIKQFG